LWYAGGLMIESDRVSYGASFCTPRLENVSRSYQKFCFRCASSFNNK
jgi:hypothetical protein